MSHLRPCSGCSRHVRANVTVCPFCDAALMIEEPRTVVSNERLGRAARMALGSAAALANSVAACDGNKPPPKENIAMPYGAPPNPLPVGPDGSGPDVPDAAPVAVAAVDAAPPAAADAGQPGADAGKPKPKPTATAIRTPPPNLSKPYGAPPADGYDFFDV